MALPSSGTISFDQINVELGLSATATIDMNNATVRALFGVASGAIGMNNGHGKARGFVRNIVISTDVTNYNLRNVLIGLGWDTIVPAIVTVTINSGIYVSSNNTSIPAFETGTYPAGSTINITNNGFIVGMGGAGGAGGASGGGEVGFNGGTALNATYTTTITNNGTIAGGGGGGNGAAMVFYAYGQYGGGGGGGGRSGRQNSAGGIGGAGAAAAGGAGGVGTNLSAGTGGAGSYGNPGGAGGDWGATSGGTGGACSTNSTNIVWTTTGTRYGVMI